MNGAYFGNLCFRNDEFEQVRNSRNDSIAFANDDDNG